jgi:hypothetical protein
MTIENASRPGAQHADPQKALWRRLSAWVLQIAGYGLGAFVAYVAHTVTGFGGSNEWPRTVYGLMFLSTPLFAIAGAVHRRWLLWLLIYAGLSSAIYVLIAWSGN